MRSAFASAARVIDRFHFSGSKNSIEYLYFIDETAEVMGGTIFEAAGAEGSADINLRGAVQNRVHVD